MFVYEQSNRTIRYSSLNYNLSSTEYADNATSPFLNPIFIMITLYHTDFKIIKMGKNSIIEIVYMNRMNIV